LAEVPSFGLVRSLSLIDIVMVGIAAMIGGAIFVLIGPAMHEAGPALLIVFVINGGITLFTAMTYAELGSALPEAGGGYGWIRAGLPRPNAFISGWMAWFAHMIAGSLYAIGFGSFFAHLLTMMGILSFEGLDKLIAALALVLFTFINIKGVSDTGKIGSGITFLQISIIVILIASGLYAISFSSHDWPQNFHDFFPNGTIGIVIAMGLTFIAFEGYEIIVQTGEEVKNPKRNIPRAIFISLAVVVVLYVVFTFSFIGGLDSNKIGEESWKFIGQHKELGIIEAAKYFLPFGALLVLVGGIVSTLAALNATTFSSSRVAFAMGRHYTLPVKFSTLHKKYHTPYYATIASGVIMAVLAISFPLEQIALAAAVMFLFLFTQVNIAAIKIRQLYGEKLEYGYKIPFFPILPIIGIFTKIGLAIYLLIYNPLSWLIAIIWILIGFSIYKLYSVKQEIEHHSPLVGSEGPLDRKDYRIMVVFNHNSINAAKIASAIAKQKDGEISFVNIVTVPTQLPLTETQKFSELALSSFDEIKNQYLPVPCRYVVRLTHDTSEAILATVDQLGINLLMMDFDTLKTNRKLLTLTTCDIIGFKIGENFRNELSDIAVSYDIGRHSDLGLETAHLLSKSFNSNIKIVRAMIGSHEKERDIMSKLNEKMFDLEIKKIPIQKIPSKKETLMTDLVSYFANDAREMIFLGAGNQSESAFSPKTMEIISKTSKTVLVFRDSRLSSIQTRYFLDKIIPRLRENRHIYRIYLAFFKILQLFKSRRQISDDEYFNSKHR
jgi:APA family basic amino acid/polyamine antiporter